MLVIFNGIVFIIGIILFIVSLRMIINGSRSICLFSLLLFEVEYVLPLIVETVWYILQIHFKMFPGMDYALCDTETGYLYLMMCITVQFVLFFVGKQEKISLEDFRMPKLHPYVYLLFKCARFFPLIVVMLSPDPFIYFKYYAPFVFHRSEISVVAAEFHSKFLHPCLNVAFIATMLVQLFMKNKSKKKIFWQILSIAIYTFLNGKRTVLAFSILGLVAIEILKTKKINVKKIFWEFSFVLIFFILYSLISKKGDYYGSGYMNLVMNYILYFDRAFITKVAIFNRIHPDLVHILDYSGQSILFNLFFWVPRSFWYNKPYPYSVYFTSGTVGNKNFYMVPWRFQTSAYPEWISNFGTVGFIFFILIFLWFVKKTNNTKNFLIYFLGLIFSLYLQMFEFSGNQQYLILWILLTIFQLINRTYKEIHSHE